MKKTGYGCTPPVYIGWNQGPRDYQEDYFGVYSRNDRTLMVIADGMGGHSSGDLASKWTVDELVEGFRQTQELEALIPHSIGKILARMKESGKDMGCTLILVSVQKENEHYKVSYSWVGDSRLYLLGSSEKPTDNAKKIVDGDNRTLWLLSDDDSFVWGFYLNRELTIDQLTEHPNKNQLEFSVHPRQENIGEIILKRLRSFYINEGDKIMMCTDGIWESYRFQSEILDHLSAGNPQRIIHNHLRKSAKAERLNDNATYIVAEMNEKIFKQDCLPVKSKRRFIGQFIFGFLVLCLFIMIFLVLIGKHEGKESVSPGATHSLSSVQKGIHESVEIDAPQKEKPLSHFYSIHVGSFGNYDEAKACAEKFRKMGFQIGIISPSPEHESKEFQVRIGRYKSADEADRVKKELESKEDKVYSVKKHSR